MPVQNENKAQQEAIAHVSGPMQVLAGPGSGKTYLTIRRIRHLICNHGISPDKILVITFTKAAAKEMKDRFEQLSEGAWKQVRFGTFHSVFYSILKETATKKKTVISQKEKLDYIRHILINHGFSDVDQETSEELLSLIGRSKNFETIKEEPKILLPSFEEEELQKAFPDIMKEYCDLLRENGKLDFDDMIGECYQLLQTNTKIRERFQKEFEYILIDEFQDISPIQYEVMKVLALPKNHLFVVGDDDQSIYGFRGAGPNIMQSFMKDYKEARQVLLDTNYRCSQSITKSAGMVIVANENRFPKEIKAASKEEGFFCVLGFPTQEQEERKILEQIKNMKEDELKETAIIYRTNLEARKITEFLLKNNISVRSLQRKNSIMEDPFTNDIIAYLNCAGQLSGLEEGVLREDFVKVMNKPFRYISREALPETLITKTDLITYYQNKKAMHPILNKLFSDLTLVARLHPYAAIQYIRKVMGYEQFVKEQSTQNKESILSRLNVIQQSAYGTHSLKEWQEHLQKLDETGAKEVEEGVNVITIHASKGLEFKRVILPDLNEGKVPYRKAVTKEQIEEERRLFYVAMTRAKQELYLYYIKGTKEKGIKPSDFITSFL